MKERPILFSAPMVRAILEGRKTQTRRIVKPLPSWQVHSVCDPSGAADPWAVWFHFPETDRVGHLRECPHGKPGDRLWVREAFCYADELLDGYEREDPIAIGYRADFSYRRYDCDVVSGEGWNWEHPSITWKPSIHMPRWASRITLDITDVRVQRLQDISEEDAIAEGRSMKPGDPSGYFPETWEAINGKGSWGANTWVWALTFRRLA